MKIGLTFKVYKGINFESTANFKVGNDIYFVKRTKTPEKSSCEQYVKLDEIGICKINEDNSVAGIMYDEQCDEKFSQEYLQERCNLILNSKLGIKELVYNAGDLTEVFELQNIPSGTYSIDIDVSTSKCDITYKYQQSENLKPLICNVQPKTKKDLKDYRRGVFPNIVNKLFDTLDENVTSIRKKFAINKRV